MNNPRTWFPIVMLAAALAGAEEFHVSPEGRDAWSGRAAAARPDGSDGPFATIARARDAVRALKQAGGLTAPVEIVVHEGTYLLDAPLVLGPEDSGTQACPITYRARGRVVISGGQTIGGWKQDGVRWVTDVPAEMLGRCSFRMLRVGDDWARRARFPDHDPGKPFTGGWLFADFGGEPWECGRLNHAVSDLQNAGSRLGWRIRVPADGRYEVWVRYSSDTSQQQVEDMGGRTTLQADEGAAVPLMRLPGTGAWNRFAWSRSASLPLTRGEHRLTWANVRGGGLGLDAIVLVSNASWDPDKAVSAPTWWGAFTVSPPASGHLILIQAEACDRVEGGQIKVPKVAPAGHNAHLVFRPGDLGGLKSLEGAEVHVFPAWGWVNGIIPIERVDRDARRIVFPPPGAGQEIRMGNRYFIENLREALDAPGEWYLDRGTRRLEYIPQRSDFEGRDVWTPRLDRLLECRGDGGSRWVEHVRLEGLIFTDTDYTVTAEYYSPADAAVHLSGVRNCGVNHCRFERLGGYAVKLTAGSHHVEFTGNTVEYCGQGGVLMAGNTADQPHHNLVAGNRMRHLGLVYAHVAAVYCVTASDNRILNNTISDVSRYGIAMKCFSGEACSLRNLVEFNDIRRSNLQTNDTGAIEMLGRAQIDTHNVVRHNLVLDVVGVGTDRDGRVESPYFNWGIYLDDYTSGATVTGNIVARTANGGLCVHGGRNNLFANNVFVDAGKEQIRLQPRDEFMKNNRFVQNIIAYGNPEADLIYSWQRGSATFAEWDRNLYWCRGGDLAQGRARITPAGTYAQWRAAGHDEHTIIADPRFVDPARDDYRLRDDSPARSLGFADIPVDRIGAEHWPG
jgi:parallel beta-helix repeat protein